MKVFAKSDVGKARQNNEDFYYVSSSEDFLKLYILADGMGGYNGGEIASRLATAAVKSYIESNFNKIPHEREDILALIKNAVEYANMIVYEKSKENQELENMGTTLEVCLIYNNKAFIGHIGDSRIYRIRKNIIRKLTVDHSYVQELVNDGTITKEEAIHHPKKNMLMKALGCTPFVEPDITVKGFLKDDIIVICSDGLTNMITEQEIYNTVIQDNSNTSEILVNKANELGGYDNITVITIYNN
ncbi:MAG: Stp1/IreP family PP2C-type Ser/Thr phosphatase [Clostridia bacterium]|nr:Stp1/IreP family PP2C-type Ser/Thr phosphatase [Clostridia bacterium]